MDWRQARKWGVRRLTLKQEAERLQKEVGDLEVYKIQLCVIMKASHYKGWYVLGDDGMIIRSEDWIEIFKFIFRRPKKYIANSSTWQEQQLFLSVENE